MLKSETQGPAHIASVAVGALAGSCAVAVLAKCVHSMTGESVSWMGWSGLAFEAAVFCAIIWGRWRQAAQVIIVFALASCVAHAVGWVDSRCGCLGALHRLSGCVHVMFASAQGLLACVVLMRVGVKTAM